MLINAKQHRETEEFYLFITTPSLPISNRFISPDNSMFNYLSSRCSLYLKLLTHVSPCLLTLLLPSKYDPLYFNTIEPETSFLSADLFILLSHLKTLLQWLLIALE